MPFVPHTPADVQHMLATIGIDAIDTLFDEIPADLRCAGLDGVAEGLPEMDMLARLGERARADDAVTCFAGAGSYDHHIPAAVWDLVSRGEFMTCYTPYQAEASQGTLQLIYEYQSMMTALTGLAVSNASVYDGGSALAEALLMAVRAQRKLTSRRILVPVSVSPFYRRVARSIVANQGLEIVELPVGDDGVLDPASLQGIGDDFAALVIAQPNFFGRLEAVDALVDWAHAQGRLAVAVVNPTALAVLKPPGQWGHNGADIALGDGQSLGVPMASGGPSFGFMCCRKGLERQMPGRIVGRTTDAAGNDGFVLTLQAREQHIRRAKATSNICTNQGLLVTAGTIHMAIVGADGLAAVARQSVRNTRALTDALCRIDGVEPLFHGPHFHERAVRLPVDDVRLVEQVAERHRILPGVALSPMYDELGSALLVCATEKRTPADIERCTDAVAEVVEALR